MNRLKFILLSFVAIILFACTNDCFQPDRVLVGVNFYDAKTKKPKNINFISVKGVGSDSVLYKSQTTNSIFLPLKIDSENTEFEVCMTDSSRIFSMKFNHNTYPQYISKECGCAAYQTINDVTFQASDSILDVVILKSEVENTNGETNVQVFL